MGMPKTELRPAWRNYIGGLGLAALFILSALGSAAAEAEGGDGGTGGIMFLLAAAVLAAVVIRRYSWKFSIDDKRVSRHYGLVARNQQSLKIRDLRSVEMDQGIVQRLLGTGTLKFYSAGSGDAEIKFPGIKDPAGWRDKIDDALDKLQEQKD